MAGVALNVHQGDYYDDAVADVDGDDGDDVSSLTDWSTD